MLGDLTLRRVRSGPSRGGGEFYRVLFAFEALILCHVWGFRSVGFLIRIPGTHRQHAALLSVGQVATFNWDRGTDTSRLRPRYRCSRLDVSGRPFLPDKQPGPL